MVTRSGFLQGESHAHPLLLAIIILVVSQSIVTSFPDGPPETACIDMLPGTKSGAVGPEGHLTPQQNILPTYGNKKTPPYYILLNSDKYTPGQEITVSTVANQTAGMVMFKGLLLQARRVLCASDIGKDNETIMVEETPLGYFRPISSDQLLKTMTCAGIKDSALGHRSSQFKINETASWVAPSTPVGHIVFKATIVQESYTYWTNLHSKIILDPSSPEPEPRPCGSVRIISEKTMPLLVLLITLNNMYNS